MKKSKGFKKAKRRLVLLMFVLLGISMFIGGSLFKTWLKIVNNRKDVVALKEEYNSLLNQEKQLKSDVNKLQDPDYVARYAREKYLYTKEGELIIRIPSENN